MKKSLACENKGQLGAGSPYIGHVSLACENKGQLGAGSPHIGHVSLACENETGGSWGQEVLILHVNI